MYPKFATVLLAASVAAVPTAQAPAAVTPAVPSNATQAAAPSFVGALTGAIRKGDLNALIAWMLPNYTPLADGGYDITAVLCATFSSGGGLVERAVGWQFGSPSEDGGKCEKDTSGGKGKFAPAGYFKDASIPARTIYAPLSVKDGNKGAKLPVIVWGNGACLSNGVMFQVRVIRSRLTAGH